MNEIISITFSRNPYRHAIGRINVIFIQVARLFRLIESRQADVIGSIESRQRDRLVFSR